MNSIKLRIAQSLCWESLPDAFLKTSIDAYPSLSKSKAFLGIHTPFLAGQGIPLYYLDHSTGPTGQIIRLRSLIGYFCSWQSMLAVENVPTFQKLQNWF